MAKNKKARHEGYLVFIFICFCFFFCMFLDFFFKAFLKGGGGKAVTRDGARRGERWRKRDRCTRREREKTLSD